MNIKRFIILPFLFLAFGWAMGQNDVLLLKDGSIIRGTITEYLAKDHIRIKTEEGKFYEYPDSEIKKISFKGEKSVFSLKEKGYYNVASFGLLMGINQWGGIAGQPSLQVVQGYQFKGRMNAGIGTGLEVVRGDVTLPVFGEYRYHLKKEGFSPFVAANAGYSFLLTGRNYYNYYSGEGNNSKGGVMGGMQFGIRNYTRQNLGWTFSMGYRFQQLRRSYDYEIYNFMADTYSFVPVVERTSMHRLELRFGILFN
jgi:hypothetical protein